MDIPSQKIKVSKIDIYEWIYSLLTLNSLMIK